MWLIDDTTAQYVNKQSTSIFHLIYLKNVFRRTSVLDTNNF